MSMLLFSYDECGAIRRAKREGSDVFFHRNGQCLPCFSALKKKSQVQRVLKFQKCIKIGRMSICSHQKCALCRQQASEYQQKGVKTQRGDKIDGRTTPRQIESSDKWTQTRSSSDRSMCKRSNGSESWTWSKFRHIRPITGEHESLNLVQTGSDFWHWIFRRSYQ